MKAGRKFYMQEQTLVQKLRRSELEEPGHIIEKGEALHWPSTLMNCEGEEVQYMDTLRANRDYVPRWMFRAFREKNNLSRKQLATLFSPYEITEKQIAKWLRPSKADDDLLPIDVVMLLSVAEKSNLIYKEIFTDERIKVRSMMDKYWGWK